MTSYKYIREILNHPYNKGRKFRALRRYVEWNLGRRLLAEAEYVVELIAGTHIIISNRENYATLAYTCRLYDFEEMFFLLHALKQGDCFGDFGANVGVYSVLAGSTGASVLAVEPIPATFDRLCANFRLNQVAGSPLNCGLSDKPQTLIFTTDRGGMNKVVRSAGANTCQVCVTTVDDLVAKAGASPCLIKVDVEGYEMPLLMGATGLLESDLFGLIIEMNESGREYGFSDLAVHELLSSYGFNPFRYNPVSREIEPRDGINRNSLNTLYLKSSSLSGLRRRLRDAGAVVLAGVTI
jgi:FkbM family methyltransferase